MKLYTYSEDQVNSIYKYLMQKPMLETEKLVAALRSPLKIEEVPVTTQAPTQEAPATETTSTTTASDETQAEAN